MLIFQDELGQYQYGYANEHSVKNELRTADGIVRGSYRYIKKKLYVIFDVKYQVT